MGSKNGFDVVIICTNTDMMAQFWQNRLEASRGSVIPSNCIVLSVFEDWPGGAGNAFGTFYAWKKACIQAESRGMNLHKSLAAKEVSCAIFHTAGKGTRLAPLPGSENNNKPGVKLPVTVDGSGGEKAMTILESVIKQTGIYASSRKGRLSVFWGDQVFIPSVSPLYTPEHHADILCTLGPMPGPEEWKAKGLDKYGLIAVGSGNEAAQVEKVDHETALRLLSSLGQVKAVGASLGSFSVSAFLLTLLMDEFDAEISDKQGKLDTDPGLWMPMTLSKVAYVEIMAQKGEKEKDSTKHYDRMMTVKNELVQDTSMKLFGAVDVGTTAYWWDYGQLVLYRKNNMKLLENNHEALTMKKFFNLPQNGVKDSELYETMVSVGSCVSGSLVKSGNIKSSLLCKVTCSDCDCEDAILVNVTATRIKVAPGCIVYNVVSTDPNGIVIDKPGSVLTSTLQASGVNGANMVTLRSHLDLDGGKVWKTKVLENDFSFEEIYNSNGAVDVSAMDKIGIELHKSAATKVVAPSPECEVGCTIA